MVANGVMEASHMETGHLMSPEPTLIPMETRLSSSDGTPSGLDVIFLILLQPLVLRWFVLDQAVTARLAPSIQPSTVLEA
jgi:hypothetical protein